MTFVSAETIAGDGGWARLPSGERRDGAARHRRGSRSTWR